MPTVLHMCTAGEWAAAQERGVYRAGSLDDVGFVHCSDRGTVHLPANRVFAGRGDMVLLEVEIAALDVPVRWEPADPPMPGPSPWFPHIYGLIPVEAVVAVHDFPPGADGTFRLPDSLAKAV